MSHNIDAEQKLCQDTVTVYEKLGGNVSATALELNIARSTVRRRIAKLGKGKKPLASGTLWGVKTERRPLPEAGKIARYIITSAQNNTKANQSFLDNLLALAKHYQAEILIGTYSYNQNAYGPSSVKKDSQEKGDASRYDPAPWYDPQLAPYFNDNRVELGRGLVWCGEMNILPTAVNPLAGLESYSARKSAIFPHAKMAMRSIPAMQGEAAKFNYTTGTVTLRNYIQKKDGLKAEHHHVYGALIVEVNHDGHWWVRQLNADKGGSIQDLDTVACDGHVTTGHRVEAVNWGDIHSAMTDPGIVATSQDMLDVLRPKFQFMHDVMEGAGTNHHEGNNPHFKFYEWKRGLHRFTSELKITIDTLTAYDRPGTKTVFVAANHDDKWIQQWLREFDYRKDPGNAQFFLKAQAYMYERLNGGAMPRDVNMLEWCLREAGYKAKATFLIADESFLICNRKIECGMHGHLGPNGKRGTPENLSAMGRKANIGHTHSAGIFNGLYVAGTSTKLRWDYNAGPSSWSNSHIITYPSGKRAIVTVFDGKWRAGAA